MRFGSFEVSAHIHGIIAAVGTCLEEKTSCLEDLEKIGGIVNIVACLFNDSNFFFGTISMWNGKQTQDTQNRGATCQSSYCRLAD